MNDDNIQQTNMVNDDAMAATDPASPPMASIDPVPAPPSDPMVTPVPPELNQAPAPAPAPSDNAVAPAAAAPPAAGLNTQPAAGDDLDDIKKSAIGDLQPLVDKIDQPPEERFQTLMMMIRTTDDAKLIQPAYDAAKSIEDENKRANALLDVVSEIDYLKNQKK